MLNIQTTSNKLEQFFVISDIESIDQIESLVIPVDVDVIIVAGGLYEPVKLFEKLNAAGKPVIVVAGNVDFYDHDIADGAQKIRAESIRFGNIHFLDNEEIIINQVRFIGSTLWTNYGDLHPRLVLETHHHHKDSYKINAAKWYSNDENLPKLQAALDLLDKKSINTAVSQAAPTMPSLISKGLFHPVIGAILHQSSIEYIKNKLNDGFEGKTIVVTHHPPTWEAVRIRFIGQQEVDPDGWNACHFNSRPGNRSGMGSLLPEDLATGGNPYEYEFVMHPLLSICRYDGKSDFQKVFGKNLKKANVWIHGHIEGNFIYAFAGTPFILNSLCGGTLGNNVFHTSTLYQDALHHSKLRLLKVLEESIMELQNYAVEFHIQQPKTTSLKELALMALEDVHNRARQAIREFELELQRITGVSPGLSSTQLIEFPVDQAPFCKSANMDITAIDNMLSPAYIDNEINSLEKQINILHSKERWEHFLKQLDDLC